MNEQRIDKKRIEEIKVGLDPYPPQEGLTSLGNGGVLCVRDVLDALHDLELERAENERLRGALEEKEIEIAEYKKRLTNIKNEAFTALERPKIREAAKGSPAVLGPPKPPRPKGDRPQG